VSVQFNSLEGCLQDALETQTAYALSVLHLFKSSFVPTPSNVLADYTAAEADYDNYSAETLTAWFDPLLAPGSGYMITSPLVQFETGVAVTTPNLIGGCYLVDAAGKLRLVVIFTNPVPMQIPGQGIPISLIDLFPTGV